MKYQCIDCKFEYAEKHKRCPKCRSRYIIVVEEEPFADEREQPEDKQLEKQTKLKKGDIIKVNETLALLKMDAGDYYKVEFMRRDYYEECCCLIECDENGVVEESHIVELPSRSLDYWLDTDSIEILET